MLVAETQGSPEFKIAYTIGLFVGILLPVLFLVLALRTLSKPNHSRKCALSVSALMAGWALSSLFSLLAHLSGASGLEKFGYGLGGLLALPVLVLAVWGLIDVVHSTPMLSGAWQSVLSLALCGVFVIGAALAGLVASRGVPNDWKMPQTPAGGRVSVVSKNFSLAVPGGDWVHVIPSKLNQRADVAFVNPGKTLYFMVLAHQVPAGSVMHLDRFTEAARGEIKQIDPAGMATTALPKVIGAYPGMEFSADDSVQGKPFTYYEWLTVKGSVAYQVIAWSPRADAALMKVEATRIAGSFESLAP